MRDKYFEALKPLFAKAGYRLYLVGGSVRDLLLGLAYADEDFVTDATPEEMKVFLPEADYTFARYGSIRVPVLDKKVDVTTLRVEAGYGDHRHPSSVRFVKTPKEDALRRDFTINALYLDENYSILDYVGGQADLEAKLLRFIGNPETRIKEDPLRIIRAERFKHKLGFAYEEKTGEALERCHDLLNELNPAKVEQERKKEGH